MSVNGNSESDPGSITAKTGVCPHLGWYVDSETHHAYASAANHCHTQSPPLTIQTAYQTSTCLEGDWASCPRFKAAQTDGVVEKPAAIPWIGRGNGKGRRPPRWAVAGIAVAAMALIIGLFLVLRPVAGLTGSATPTEAGSLAQSTRTDVAATSATEAALPAASATLVATATENSLPTQPSQPTQTATPTATDLPSATPSPTPSPVPTEADQASPTPVPTLN